MKVVSACTLLAVFCFGAIAVFPTYALLPSTNPNLAVRLVDPGLLGASLIDPQHLIFDQYHNWNGTHFGADVYLENLDIGWALTNANFTLSYNDALTNLVSTALDPAWTGTVDTTTTGIIDVNAITSASLSGIVLVLEVTFNIQGQHTMPPVPVGYRDISNLQLSDISLSGDAGPITINLVKDGVVTVYAVHVHPAYDLRITSVAQFTPHFISGSPQKSVVGQGFSLILNVTGENWGFENVTFTVTAYANTTPIGSENITVLGWIGNSTTAFFTWNTTSFNKGNYRISASPTLPEGETGYIMNFTDGWITVAMVGDITGLTTGIPDGKVDIRDLAVLVKNFGVYWWEPSYNINYDLTGFTLGVPDGKTDIKDLALAAKNYGKTDP